MTDVTGTDIPKGREVKWYFGGVASSETHTVTAQEATALGFALSGTADYGSVIAQVGSTVTAVTEYTTSTSTPADEENGCGFIGYSGITEGDVVTIKYVAVGVTPLTHIASCQDVSLSSSADTKKASVQGQSNKLSSVGAVENTATLNELVYNEAFVSAILGDAVSASPATGKEKWTNAFSGMKKIGALVGKRLNAAGAVAKKWFLVGAQANDVGQDFPTEDYYKRSMSFDVDYFTVADLS
ncbi:MAG TPA: hypothetical protein PLY91_09355 [Methanoregulaceae archaeon]|nr:hypothetical protein [Methanoregulaceae archaeon]